jgi:hypothetical protein
MILRTFLLTHPLTIREVTHSDASYSKDERGRRSATCPARPIK